MQIKPYSTELSFNIKLSFFVLSTFYKIELSQNIQEIMQDNDINFISFYNHLI